MSVRVVQITDLHLMADPRAELKGTCTRDRFETVLDVLRCECLSAERLIVTGDLAHDELRETYEALCELLAEWLPKLRIIPGNHDNREAMRAVFGDRIQVLDDRNVFAEEVGGWKLIGLDSQLPGELRGQLGDRQRDWFTRELTAEPTRPTAIFLHHPPVRVGSEWLDRIGLDDADLLLALLQQHSQVKLIACGHIHQEWTCHSGSLLVLATPSTGVQFQPETETLVVDSVSPGLRILDLETDGSLRTRVIRVPFP